MLNNGMTLGELIDILSSHPPEDRVRFEFGGCVPTKLDSYRGYYEDLALGFSDAEFPPTIAELTRDLQLALVCYFHGYKGGKYRMSRATSVWVANYRNTSDTTIVSVRRDEGVTWLVTGHCET